MEKFEAEGEGHQIKLNNGNEKVFLILESSEYIAELMDASNECGRFFNLLLLRSLLDRTEPRKLHFIKL